MRQHNQLAGRYRPQERTFLTEARFLKFARARTQDNPTNLVRATTSLFSNATPIDVVDSAETGAGLTIAKGRSA